MKSPYKGKFKVTQIYKGLNHKGIDLVGIDSKNIYAPFDGKVVASRKDTYVDGGMGNYVKIQDSKGRYHLFAHMSKLIAVAGQTVKEGDLIGVEGNTGHSFGSHCHYEVRQTTESKSFQDVSEISGIPNKLGTYEQKDEVVEVVKEVTMLIDGKMVTVNAINVDGSNFVKLKDLGDVLEIGYDSSKRLPVVNRK